MATKTTKKKGETSTTVAVGIRIDPKIKFALDLMGRMQKRSLTAVVEWAISNAIAQQRFRGPDETFADAVEKVWSTDESTRFVQQALYMPETLTYDELRIWETIKATKDFWFLTNVDGSPNYSEHSIMLDMVRFNWQDLLDHVDENKSRPTIVPLKQVIPF